MKKPEIQSFPDQPAIQLKPIISYPRIAEPGEHYLLTIDLQLAENSPWPYPEEEFEISFVLKTEPFFQHEPFGQDEPGLVLHRFGNTYGPAEYLLTASQQPVPPGKITIILLNGWGLPIAHLELECEVKQEIQEKISTIRRAQKGHFSTSFTSSSLAQVEEEDTLHSEKEQRDLIAQQLSLVGWKVVSMEDLDISQYMDLSRPEDLLLGEGATEAIRVPPGNVALRGYPSIENDYLLFIERKIVGYVKVYDQQKQLPDARDVIKISGITKGIDFTFKGPGPLNLFAGTSTQHPFLYHTTFYETIFSQKSELPSFRNVYTFHQPTTLAAWFPQRSYVSQGDDNVHFHPPILYLPTLEQGNLFDYQFAAIQKIEESLLSSFPPRTLIQIKTNTGKTHTAVYSIYRLIAYAHAKHILYIVDVPLAKQYAFDAFNRFPLTGLIVPPPYEYGSFTSLYKVSMITNEKLDPSVHVYIGTLEDLYNIYDSGVQGDRLPRPASRGDSTEPMSLVKEYCKTLPIEYFDVTFLAESEYINYQRWQPVLDYFDTFYIGIADTVSDEVLHFFDNNLVSPLTKNAETMQKTEDATSLSMKQKQISGVIKNVQVLLRRDTGIYGDTDALTYMIWLLFLKYLDDYELVQQELLGESYIPIITEGYRWRDWVTSTTPYNRRKGYELLQFINEDLIPYLARLYGETNRDIRTITSTIFRDTYNRIRSGYILREVVDKLDTINFNSSDDIHDISLYYETILKEIRDTAGDAGEFYTPLPIVRFMIDCLNPQFGENILDPACGAAGFLIETYKRLVGQVRTPEQQQRLQDSLIGIEKRPMPYLLAIMNMLLHGIEAPNLQEGNALANINLRNIMDKDRADIIATNPPLGGREERAAMHNFPDSMRTTETTPLFVQYCMATLKRSGGRCGIVVSSSFLSGKGAIRNIKHSLLTRFRLHTIVRLPPGVFSPYTSISTNILFFEANEGINYLKEQSGTKEIWYYEIPLPEGRRNFTKTKPIQDEHFRACLAWWDHREENEHAWKVSIEYIIANNYNLDVKNPH